MGKWAGKVGFAELIETAPGVYEEKITPHLYYGDVISINRRLQSTANLNDDIKLSNRISIVADPFANHNFQSIRYVTFMDAKWKVTDVEVQYPRLILTLGGIYNDNE